MGELVCILFSAGLALALITVVGHGLWLVAAAVLGDKSSSGSAQPDAPVSVSGGVCRRCGLPLDAQRCGVCDWPETTVARRPYVAFKILEQQIRKLTSAGVLDATASQRLTEVVDAQRSRVLGELAAAQKLASPIVTAVTVEEPTSPEGIAAVAPAVEPVPGDGTLVAPAPLIATPVRDDREFASELSVRERAEQVQARQQAAAAASQPAAAARAVPAPPEPVVPRRAWTDYLSAFMEDRNIRWGELVGGLLIVGCSIALVISFWAAIAERPLLKFLLFGGVTAVLFGVGFYSERRWRLHTTSQGLLLISTLLVPLNFLAIAAFTSADAANDPVTLAGELLSTLLFATLIYLAGKILIARGAVLLVVGVLLPSLVQLLIRRWVDGDASGGLLLALAGAPLACYLSVNLWHLWRESSGAALDESRVEGLFKLLGVSTFAAALPVALLLYKSTHPIDTLRQMPVIVSLFGIAPLGVGLLLWQRLRDTEMATMRLVGTAVAVLGAVISVSGLIAAWPEPAAMLPTAIVEFAVFTLMAWRFELPIAHLVAAACGALAYLLVVYLGQRELAWTGQSSLQVSQKLVSGPTGTLLAPLVLVYAAAAWLAIRRGARITADTLLFTHGGTLSVATAALVALSVALVAWYGIGRVGDPVGVTWVLGLYAHIGIVASTRLTLPIVPWASAALLLASVVQAIVYQHADRWELVQPQNLSLLVFAGLTAAIAAAAGVRRATVSGSPLAQVFWLASLASSVLCAVWLLAMIPATTPAFQAARWPWLAVVWLSMAVATGWRPLWTLTQLAVTNSVVAIVIARLAGTDWYQAADRPLLDPWTLASIGTALAVVCLLWALARIVARSRFVRADNSRRQPLLELLESPYLSLDRVIGGLLVVLVVALSLYAAVPGVMQELSPGVAKPPGAATGLRNVPPIENFEFAGISHLHAGTPLVWLFLACVLLLVLATLWQMRYGALLIVAIVLAALVCPLAAARFESQVAVASALRWLTAAILIVGSLPIWFRYHLSLWAERLGWRAVDSPVPLQASARTTVFALGLLPSVLMAGYVAFAALDRAFGSGTSGMTPGPGTPVPMALLPTLILFGVMVVLSVSVIGVPSLLLRGNDASARPTWPWAAGSLMLVLGAAPLISIFLYNVAIALKAHPILGPDPASIFARMGLAGSYAVPILLTSVALVGYAMRESSSGFALAGGLVLCLAATAAYLLAISKYGLVFDTAQWIRLAQLNASVGAVYGLAWLGVLMYARRQRREHAPFVGDFVLDTQVALSPALIVLAFVWSWCALIISPQGNPGIRPLMSSELADAWGWGALLLTCAITACRLWLAGRRLSQTGINALLTVLVIMAAVYAARWDTGNWVAYNTLIVGHSLVACVLLGLEWRRRWNWLRESGTEAGLATADQLKNVDGSFWIDVNRLILFVLGLREFLSNDWWSVGAFLVIGWTGAVQGWVFQRRRFLYNAGLLTNVAGMTAAYELGLLDAWSDPFYVFVFLLSAPVIVWLWIELAGIGRRQFKPRFALVPFHRVAVRVSIGVLMFVVFVGLVMDALAGSPNNSSLWLPWLALGTAVLAAVACLWDVQARDGIARLYLLGLVAVAMTVDVLDLKPAWLLWTGTLVLAAFVLATSYLWSRRKGLIALGQQLGIPYAPSGDLAGMAWLVPSNLLLIGLVIAGAALVELTNRDVALRHLAAQAVLIQVASAALLARGDRRGVLQGTALTLGAIGAVMFAWSWLDPLESTVVLNALVLMAAALAVVTGLYGFGLGKLLKESSDWLVPARSLTPWLAGACGLSLVSVLLVEIRQFMPEPHHVEIGTPAMLTVAATLIALCLAALAAAILPGRDPLNLSERGRTLYVYLAEIVLALLFLHIRLTKPWLFHGFFRQYWPLIVMGIAFLGVGFAEYCRRRRHHVLAEPLHNTGALLPALPVLGFWAADSKVDYSLLLVTVGMLYAGLSVARRSFGFGILAALAANGGLWFFLNHQAGWGFLVHPQIWLIPPAACILIAAYLNRAQLSEQQMTGIRYFTSTAIYVSSTADVFLNGTANSPWLPVVLAGISIVGILAGILMRVRGFLFLGVIFLTLAIFTIIWHAAVDLDQTWIWYASGLVTGVLIVALFGLFEKKRQDVDAVLSKIKQWEG